MKILNNFNTKLDEIKLENAINFFGKWNVVLFKRYSVYLWALVFYFILLILIFLSVLTSIYFQLQGNEIFKFASIWIYSLFFLIWLTFTISKLKAFLVGYNPIMFNVTEYDFHDGKFEMFIRISFIFYFIQIFTATWLSIWEYLYAPQASLVWFLSLKVQIILQIVMFFVMFKILMRILKFEMDYYLVTPKYIDINIQHSLFEKQNTIVEMSKITSIRFINSWIISSYFNYGKIVISTEWNSKESTEYEIQYAPNIDFLNKIIGEISGIKQ